MTQPAGRTLALTRARQWMCDLVASARRVPTGSIQRSLQLAEVAAQQALDPQPSWCALFTKAYGIVAAARPELRRLYTEWPWPHFYEHPENVATVAIERPVEHEAVVCFAHLRQPQNLELEEIETVLRRTQEASLETMGIGQRRGFLWRLGMRLSAQRRARVLGTFGVTDESAMGSALLQVLTPLTTTLTYGAVDEKGKVNVRLTFDRRVLDGATAARVLEELEGVLLRESINRQRVCDLAVRAGGANR